MSISQMQEAMLLLLKTFQKYASEDGDPKSLSKAEVKKLLKTEMPGMLEGAKNQAEVDKIIADLDFNGDSVVDFTEFMVLTCAITCAFQGMLEGQQ